MNAFFFVIHAHNNAFFIHQNINTHDASLRNINIVRGGWHFSNYMLKQAS